MILPWPCHSATRKDYLSSTVLPYLSAYGAYPLAYGSMRQMRSYAQKVFAKDARLAQLTDARSNPTLPLSAVLSTWQWGLLRQTPSTEQIGDLLKDRRWLARLGLQPEQGGSPDRAAQILDGLSTEEWQQMMLEGFCLARR